MVYYNRRLFTGAAAALILALALIADQVRGWHPANLVLQGYAVILLLMAVVALVDGWWQRRGSS